MKILFVCSDNLFHSQAAEAFFNKLSKEHRAISAGTHAIEGAEAAVEGLALHALHEVGVDLYRRPAQLLTRELFDSADRVVVLTDKSLLPDYVKGHKVLRWEVGEVAEKGIDLHREARDRIVGLVEKFVAEIE